MSTITTPVPSDVPAWLNLSAVVTDVDLANLKQIYEMAMEAKPVIVNLAMVTLDTFGQITSRLEKLPDGVYQDISEAVGFGQVSALITNLAALLNEAGDVNREACGKIYELLEPKEAR